MQERYSASDRNAELLVTVHIRYVYCKSSNEKPSESRRTVPFVWNTEHEHAFNKVKEVLSTTPGLRLFDPNLKVQIQCDASKTSICACLLREGQPVAYYSKALTPTEMNWFPTKKECLTVVCAAEKFQHYIYGREVEVRSERDFDFPDTNVVKALLAMLSALRLVAGSKHAPRAFGSATWQAGASSERGIHKTNQNARKVN